MMSNKRPGHQPDPDDMSGTFDAGREPTGSAAADPSVTREEEEAERLGDFA
jgi:hypothetical protein